MAAGPSAESIKEDLWYKIVTDLQSPFLKGIWPPTLELWIYKLTGVWELSTFLTVRFCSPGLDSLWFYRSSHTLPGCLSILFLGTFWSVSHFQGRWEPKCSDCHSVLVPYYGNCAYFVFHRQVLPPNLHFIGMPSFPLKSGSPVLWQCLPPASLPSWGCSA